MQAYTKGHVTLRGTMRFPRRFEVNPALLYPHKDSVNGIVHDKHITLLYGLFPTATIDWPKEVNIALQDLMPHTVTFDTYGMRALLVGNNTAAIVMTTNDKTLYEMNAKLVKTFPHIDDLYPFKPHVTLLYVHQGAEDQVVESIKRQLETSAGRALVEFTPTDIKVKEPSW